jgi:hypothetical protein
MHFMIQSSLPIAASVYVPPLAPIVLLAFLGAGFLVFGLAVAAAVSGAAQREGLARRLGGAAGAVAAAYAVLLFGASVASGDRTLPVGDRKVFCEIDCHLAYSIASASVPAPGRLAVSLRAWFDPSTTAAFRGNAPLTPGPRAIYLVDAAGRRLAPSPAATRAWEARHGPSAPLDQPLRPGEESTTTFVFELPPDFRSPRLFVGDPPGVESALIGHENSPGHGKAYFALPG